jgi:cyclopropane fatty-acyl-phospholipid synthase-like methyltransferase
MKFKMKKTSLVTDNKFKHLGGNLKNGDPDTFSEKVWNELLSITNPKKILDLGSGRGHTSKWFRDRGLDVCSVDGLLENVVQAIVPTELHDLTLGSFVRPVDLVICVEVVEHIEEKFLENLLASLANGEYIFMTHAIPGQDGYHHVNCQESEYWIKHLENKNFQLLERESTILRNLASEDNAKWLAQNGMLFQKNLS